MLHKIIRIGCGIYIMGDMSVLNIILIMTLMCTLILPLCSCGKKDSSVDEDILMLISGQTEISETSTPPNNPQPSSDLSTNMSTPSNLPPSQLKTTLLTVYDYRDLNKIGLGEDDWEYKFIKAFVEKDTETLEEMMYLPEGTYDSYKTIELSEYSIKWVDSQGGLRLQFTISISKSENDVLVPGEHEYILLEGGIHGAILSKVGAADISFWYDSELSARKALQAYLHFACDIEVPTLKGYNDEQSFYFNITSMTVGLSSFFDGTWSLTEKEIIEKAKKYFNLPYFEISKTYPSDRIEDDKYSWVFSSMLYSYDFVSEEIIEEVNVITLQFYADWSKTVRSHLIEYRLKEIDSGYAFLSSKMLKESSFPAIMVWN